MTFEHGPLNVLPIKELHFFLLNIFMILEPENQSHNYFFIGCCTFGMEFLKAWPLFTGRSISNAFPTEICIIKAVSLQTYLLFMIHNVTTPFVVQGCPHKTTN